MLLATRCLAGPGVANHHSFKRLGKPKAVPQRRVWGSLNGKTKANRLRCRTLAYGYRLLYEDEIRSLEGGEWRLQRIPGPLSDTQQSA